MYALCVMHLKSQPQHINIMKCWLMSTHAWFTSLILQNSVNSWSILWTTSSTDGVVQDLLNYLASNLFGLWWLDKQPSPPQWMRVANEAIGPQNGPLDAAYMLKCHKVIIFSFLLICTGYFNAYTNLYRLLDISGII